MGKMGIHTKEIMKAAIEQIVIDGMNIAVRKYDEDHYWIVVSAVEKRGREVCSVFEGLVRYTDALTLTGLDRALTVTID